MERTTVAQRRLCYERHQRGETYAAIAEQLGVSQECIRYWCRQQRDGRTMLHTRYRRACAGILSTFDPLIRYVILRVRLQHPRWGVGRIRYALAQHEASQRRRLPSPCQIGRYLHQWKRFRRSPQQPLRRQRLPSPQYVHQRWQLDFKLGIPLGNGRLVNLYTVRDPIGAACITAVLYDAGAVGHAPHQITLPQTRQTLRRGFTAWNTLPEQIQTDHQTGLVATSPSNDFPTLFTLWLKGLHIDHVLIRPGRPTDNAAVERCHRTLMDYAITGQEHGSLEHLQPHLDRAVHDLNFALPSQASGCHGLPPVTAHPNVLHPLRPFCPAGELAMFDLQAVDAYLAQLAWERTVSKVGQVHLGAYRYSVGRQYARHRIHIRFDQPTRQFLFYDGETEIRRHPARGLDAPTIIGLDHPQEAVGPQQLPLPLSECSFSKG